MRLGDLDALRDEIDTWGCNDYDKYDFIEAIDNAPTVDIPNYGGQVVPDMLQGWRYEERPQGEWIKEDNGKTTDLYRCSICGRSIMLCKNADLSKYPFCHCGAKMKGGKE